MKEMLTITVAVPHPCLSPNSRKHWRVVSKAKRAARIEASLVTRVEMNGAKIGGGWTEAEARVKWYASTNRRRDRDNAQASLKAHFDGIADAGLIVNDAGLVHFPLEFRIDKDNPRVEIELRRIK